MGKMYTLKPDESINDHMKVSIDTISHIVELSIGCMRDLSNPHEGTFVDMTYNEFMFALEHIRNTIEMLDELTDELEESKDEVRREYEEKVIQFFNRFMNADLNDETNYRLSECVRHIHEIQNHYMSEIRDLEGELKQERKTIEERETLCDELRKTIETLAGNCPYRDKYCDAPDCAECEHARINVLARQQKELEVQRAVIKDRNEVIQNLRNEIETLKKRLEAVREDEKHWYEVAKERTNEVTDLAEAKIKETNKLKNQIADLIEERDYYQDCLHKLANRASNFCGNCAHYAQMGKDNDEYEGICTQHYIKRVDPDDASCEHFESNQVDRDKPDQPCCKACNRDDCDDCTLCPF